MEQAVALEQLNGPLKSALRAMIGLLTEIHPRFIPRSCQSEIVVYTDAYFIQNGEVFSPGSEKVPQTWNKSKSPDLENRWGMVLAGLLHGW